MSPRNRARRSQLPYVAITTRFVTVSPYLMPAGSEAQRSDRMRGSVRSGSASRGRIAMAHRSRQAWRAVGVGDQRHPGQSEMPADRVEVGDLLVRTQSRRIGRQRGATRPALIVEDDDVVLGERREVARNALEVDAGPTVNRDHGV